MITLPVFIAAVVLVVALTFGTTNLLAHEARQAREEGPWPS